MIPDKHIYIANPVIQAIPIQENGEGLVQLREYAAKRGSRIRVATGVSVREGVADKLINAQLFLPQDHDLYVVEGYRSIEAQTALWWEHRAQLEKEHTQWSNEELDRETSKLYSPPGAVMPHSTGGAIDVTLVHGEHVVDMGTPINVSAEAYGYKTYTLAQDIEADQRQYRDLLIDAMGKALFINYSTEWWHWSTGDQYWAYHTDQPFAVYDVLPESTSAEK